MALPTKVTFADKVDGATGATGQFTAADANELKTRLNALIDFVQATFDANGVLKNAKVPYLADEDRPGLVAVINDQIALAGGGTNTTTPTLGTPTVSFGAVTATSVVVNWTAVANATSYTVKRGTTTIYTGPLLTFTDSSLTASTAYAYTVVPTATGYTNGNAGTATTSTAAAAPGGGGLIVLRIDSKDEAATPGNAVYNGFTFVPDTPYWSGGSPYNNTAAVTGTAYSDAYRWGRYITNGATLTGSGLTPSSTYDLVLSFSAFGEADAFNITIGGQTVATSLNVATEAGQPGPPATFKALQKRYPITTNAQGVAQAVVIVNATGGAFVAAAEFVAPGAASALA